ncbi:MAG: Crp/Fnr family transcriptional regulator [Proteobacteria bacterium]|nr:Crp/Fnr family transcriptional regulator [Pseudomonadota bacterium]MBI3495710.1 Crp/Fnr family transcriptional regulator [Pseudomonadota bacterium]
MTTPSDWLPQDLKDRSTLRTLAAGEALFRQGGAAFGIFAVEQGRVRLVRRTADDHEVTLHTARPGELFAEASLFSAKYQCEAVAPVASRVRVYPKLDVLAALREDPKLAERFLEALAHQVHSLRARLEARNIRSARERVLQHLALSAGPDGRTVPLPGSLMNLASEIGLSHETLYRTLAALERDRRIRRTPSSIVLQKSRSL